ncbi:MAG: hypothetical protein IIA07_06815 [Proteobacteria bacterium]|nr:hypothetical protein [Pseudomonadota bacterium]
MGYQIAYTIKPNPVDQTLDVTLKLRQSRSLLREMTMRPDSRVSEIRANGELEINAGTVRWRPPVHGGTISWRVKVEHERNNNGYDAWLGPDWGLFRAEDIIPRVATRTRKGAHSDTRLLFELPDQWSVVTQYYGNNHQFHARNPERRFDQPSGWIVMGKIGVRRETIAGTRVAVAGPVANSVRRMDMLALLNWTLPELGRILPALPSRITIVSAGEPMWRGGLSAPQSMFVHADRPLISENATSTVLHEVMHLALAIKAAENFDWIVEGLAEYYSLELLLRSSTISPTRYRTAKSDQATWAQSVKALCRSTSTGATTAFAVTVLTSLDQEIRDSSDGTANLDDVVRKLWQSSAPVELVTLIEIVEQLTGSRPAALRIDNLPGCHNIVSDNSD